MVGRLAGRDDMRWIKKAVANTSIYTKAAGLCTGTARHAVVAGSWKRYSLN